MPYFQGTILSFENRLHGFANNVADLEDFKTEYFEFFDTNSKAVASDVKKV